MAVIEEGGRQRRVGGSVPLKYQAGFKTPSPAGKKPKEGQIARGQRKRRNAAKNRRSFWTF